jgi:hypothetical protein
MSKMREDLWGLTLWVICFFVLLGACMNYTKGRYDELYEIIDSLRNENYELQQQVEEVLSRAADVFLENEILIELINEVERDNQALRETLLKAAKVGVAVDF